MRARSRKKEWKKRTRMGQIFEIKLNVSELEIYKSWSENVLSGRTAYCFTLNDSPLSELVMQCAEWIIALKRIKSTFRMRIPIRERNWCDWKNAKAIVRFRSCGNFEKCPWFAKHCQSIGSKRNHFPLTLFPMSSIFQVGSFRSGQLSLLDRLDFVEKNSIFDFKSEFRKQNAIN